MKSVKSSGSNRKTPVPLATWSVYSGTLTLFQGDISLLSCEVLVNAANPQLAGGSGVDGALHCAAGPELLQAGRDWVNAHGPLPTGQALVTPAFALAPRGVKYIIHTAGPIWRGGQEQEAALLALAYSNCLHKAAALGCHSIAFPALSCGAYGFPPQQAVPVALKTILHALKQQQLSHSIVILYSCETASYWHRKTAEILQKKGLIP